MSEKKESGSLNQDDIAKLLNEMQSEESTPASEEKTDPPESDHKESGSLSQDDISKLLNEVQNDEKSPAPEEKSGSPTDDSNDSGSLNQDDISKQLNEGQNEEEDPAPEEKKAGDEISDSEMNKIKTGDMEEDNSFEGLDSISDDEIEMSDDEPDDKMDIDDTETASEPAAEMEKPASQNKKYDEEKIIKKDKHIRQKIILPEVKNNPKKKWVKLSLSLLFSTILVSGLFVGYQFYIKPDTSMNHLESPSQPEQIATPANPPASKMVEETPKLQIDHSPIKTGKSNASVVVKLEEIASLQRKLAIKKDKIAELIKNYKNAIRQMETEILKIKQTHQINTLRDAIKNKKIEFGMMTIQRRLSYIESIKQPHEWLNQGIEELQYLKNKIEIDAQISRVISGIDMDKMVREIDVVLQEYRIGIKSLEIKINDDEHISLESIWKRIINRENAATSKNRIAGVPSTNRETASSNGKNNNQVIWKEICNGNFKRKNEITALSANAAKCLSKWRHADLILNGLSDLSPGAAKGLLTWKGNWVCLNGIKKLSTETAKYLFQWQGKLISLNGLSEISSGIVEYLPHWQGKQLELMGLKYKKTKRERIGLKALAKWESTGGKLYIPIEIRKVLSAMK
jgi:hypothetical protein